jgi:hypothetical protein
MRQAMLVLAILGGAELLPAQLFLPQSSCVFNSPGNTTGGFNCTLYPSNPAGGFLGDVVVQFPVGWNPATDPITGGYLVLVSNPNGIVPNGANFYGMADTNPADWTQIVEWEAPPPSVVSATQLELFTAGCFTGNPADRTCFPSAAAVIQYGYFVYAGSPAYSYLYDPCNTGCNNNHPALINDPGWGQVSLDVGAQVRYVANLNIGDSYIDVTNTAVNGNNVIGPGGGTVGNLCVNVYAFDPNEELVACCSCLVTPDQTVSLSVNTNIASHAIETGLNSLTIKLVAVSPLVVSASNPSLTNCTNSAGGFVNDTVGGVTVTTPFANLQTGIAAWGTTVHSGPTSGIFSETETAFTPFTLSASEATSIFGRCSSIIGNLSGNGICSTCRAGSITASGLGTGGALKQ